MKDFIKNWLGITDVEYRIGTIERSIYHEPSRSMGFAVLKKHLQPPDSKQTFGAKPLDNQ